MSDIPDSVLPFSRIDWTEEAEPRLAETEGLGVEAFGAVLAHIVRCAATRDAERAVEPVSLTQDMTAPIEPETPLVFATAIDRRTRTLVFASGRAAQGERVVMTLTGVFRIAG
ncbi:MAG: hypothetical protein MRY64_06205 [Hyphomonadaceae bacterium]|nr:hypothetical protein [Hyphomonadaceae bacterium]